MTDMGNETCSRHTASAVSAVQGPGVCKFSTVLILAVSLCEPRFHSGEILDV